MSGIATRLLLDRVVGGIETGVVRRIRLEPRYPPLFIVGAPRSGTTLVYQHLANAYRWAFFPNAARWHPRACVTAAALTRLRGRPEVDYESRFGDMAGSAAPSDGWDIFHRWFPRDDYSIPVDRAHLHELRTIVRCFEMLYGAPFLNKNNSNSVRIDALAGVFPEAFFVHVDRDLAATVDSIQRGRREHGTAADAWWAAPPPAFASRSFDDELERGVAQAVGLRHAIRTSFDRLPAARRMTIDYDAFCARPGELTSWVRSAYAARGVALMAAPGPIPTSFESRRNPRAVDARFCDRVGRIATRLEQELMEAQA